VCTTVREETYCPVGENTALTGQVRPVLCDNFENGRECIATRENKTTKNSTPEIRNTIEVKCDIVSETSKYIAIRETQRVLGCCFLPGTGLSMASTSQKPKSLVLTERRGSYW